APYFARLPMQLSRMPQFLSGKRLDWVLLALAFGMALSPVKVLRPWTNDLARLVLIPLVPVTHLGSMLRDRIRPSLDSFDPSRSGADPTEVLALRDEIDRLRTMYESSRLDLARLEDALASIRATSTRAGKGAFIDVAATTGSIVASSNGEVDGIVRINAGSRHGVVPGSAVFVNGDVFAGLTSDDIGAFISTVTPSTRLPSIGCRIFPASGSDPTQPISSAPGAVLKPTGRGTWTADVASAGELTVGMIARVADDRMPRSALGARVGRVIAIAPIEQVPLARRVEVEPIAEAREATSAVVVMEAGAQPSDASANTPVSGGRR
ncbi:MAG: hypothetical protein RIR10_1226, partial [Planctomycetota bacterium]